LLQITVVAELYHHKAYTTNRNFGLDDGTGRIDAKMWTDTPDSLVEETWRGISISECVRLFVARRQLTSVSNSNKAVPFKPIYVRVTGTIKTHNNKRHIHASNIRVVKDQNEVYFHILETLSVNIILQKGLVRFVNCALNHLQCPPFQPPRPGQAQQSETAQGRSAYTIQSKPTPAQALFSSMANEVVQYLSTAPPSPEGIFVGDIAKGLNCNAMELR
jgi:replication factor A2